MTSLLDGLGVVDVDAALQGIADGDLPAFLPEGFGDLADGCNTPPRNYANDDQFCTPQRTNKNRNAEGLAGACSPYAEWCTEHVTEESTPCLTDLFNPEATGEEPTMSLGMEVDACLREQHGLGDVQVLPGAQENGVGGFGHGAVNAQTGVERLSPFNFQGRDAAAGAQDPRLGLIGEMDLNCKDGYGESKGEAALGDRAASFAGQRDAAWDDYRRGQGLGCSVDVLKDLNPFQSEFPGGALGGVRFRDVGGHLDALSFLSQPYVSLPGLFPPMDGVGEGSTGAQCTGDRWDHLSVQATTGLAFSGPSIFPKQETPLRGQEAVAQQQPEVGKNSNGSSARSSLTRLWGTETADCDTPTPKKKRRLPEGSKQDGEERISMREVMARLHSQGSARASGGSVEKQKRVPRADPPSSTTRSKVGLKEISCRVRDKVKEKQRTARKDVAEELVEEIAAIKKENGEENTDSDKPNLQRRIYDVLNVFEAVGLIEKNMKDVVWKGATVPKDPIMEELESQASQLRERINRKVACFTQLTENYAALQGLVERNAQPASPDDENTVPLPFVLVRVPPTCVAGVHISEDLKRVHMDFGDVPFQMHGDMEMLRELGLHKSRGENLNLEEIRGKLTCNPGNERQSVKGGVFNAPVLGYDKTNGHEEVIEAELDGRRQNQAGENGAVVDGKAKMLSGLLDLNDFSGAQDVIFRGVASNRAAGGSDQNTDPGFQRCHPLAQQNKPAGSHELPRGVPNLPINA